LEDGLNATSRDTHQNASKDLSEAALAFDSVMSEKDATKYLRTVKLQIEVATALSKDPRQQRDEAPPTLFGSPKKRGGLFLFFFFQSFIYIFWCKFKPIFQKKKKKKFAWN